MKCSVCSLGGILEKQHSSQAMLLNVTSLLYAKFGAVVHKIWSRSGFLPLTVSFKDDVEIIKVRKE